MKIAELYKIWFNYKAMLIKISSANAYSLLFDNHLLPYFGESETLSEEQVQDWINEKVLEGRLSKKTIGDVLIVLKMILKFGNKKGLFDYRGFDLVIPTTAKQGSTKLEVLTNDYFKKLSNYLIDNFTFQNLGILIAMHTGMRIGELCALKWSDINVEDRIFEVSRTRQRIYVYDEGWGKRRTMVIDDTTKTEHSHRDIPISNVLLKTIKPLKKIANNEYFVLTNTIKGTEPRQFRNHYHIILSRLEIPPLKFHGLRHTFATRCLAGGVDIKTTSTLLGHSKVGITMDIYMHPDAEQKRTAINKIFK